MLVVAWNIVGYCANLNAQPSLHLGEEIPRMHSFKQCICFGKY